MSLNDELEEFKESVKVSRNAVGNFDEIAQRLSVEEGELVIKQEKEDGEKYLYISRVTRTEEDSFKLVPQFDFPTFSGDESELRDAIESVGGVKVTRYGRSVFTTRNSYDVRPAEKSMEYDLKVIDFSSNYDGITYRIKLDREKIMGYTAEDMQRVERVIEEAKTVVKTKREERFIHTFKQNSVDGIFGYVSDDGYREKVGEPEDRFVEITSVITARTADHREARSHTYDVAFIDMDAAKQAIRNGKLHLVMSRPNATNNC